MVKKKAFISGPIQGMETQQGYRQTIREVCLAQEFEPIDPWRREKLIYRHLEHGWWGNVPSSDFIRRDLEDIEESDVLIAYFPQLSAGTCMELFYAKLKGKKNDQHLRNSRSQPLDSLPLRYCSGSLNKLEEALFKILG